MDDSSLLFHMCSLDSLIAMLSNNNFLTLGLTYIYPSSDINYELMSHIKNLKQSTFQKMGELYIDFVSHEEEYDKSIIYKIIDLLSTYPFLVSNNSNLQIYAFSLMSQEGLTINTNWKTYANGGEGVAIGLDLGENNFNCETKEFGIIRDARDRVYGKDVSHYIVSENRFVGLLAPVSCDELACDDAYNKLISDIREKRITASTGVSFALNDLYHIEKEFKGNHEYRLSCVRATQTVYHQMLKDRGIIHFENLSDSDLVYIKKSGEKKTLLAFPVKKSCIKKIYYYHNNSLLSARIKEIMAEKNLDVPIEEFSVF